MWNVGMRIQAGLYQNRERERAGHIPRERRSRSLALSVLITGPSTQEINMKRPQAGGRMSTGPRDSR
jgi:hypothetical protein